MCGEVRVEVGRVMKKMAWRLGYMAEGLHRLI
jgi:hypothetical protein